MQSLRRGQRNEGSAYQYYTNWQLNHHPSKNADAEKVTTIKLRDSTVLSSRFSRGLEASRPPLRQRGPESVCVPRSANLSHDSFGSRSATKKTRFDDILSSYFSPIGCGNIKPADKEKTHAEPKIKKMMEQMQTTLLGSPSLAKRPVSPSEKTKKSPILLFKEKYDSGDTKIDQKRVKPRLQAELANAFMASTVAPQTTRAEDPYGSPLS